MILKNARDAEALKRAIAKCRSDVLMRSVDGTEEYNLKSLFSQYIAIGELCKDHGDKYEIFCTSKEDEQYMLGFFFDQALEEKSRGGDC